MKKWPYLFVAIISVLLGIAVMLKMGLLNHETSYENRTHLFPSNPRLVQSEPQIAPSRLQPILNNRREVPSATIRAKLLPSDEVILLRAYQGTTNLQDRNSLTWSLAYIGGDTTTAAFEHALTDEFAGRLLRRVKMTNDFDESDSLHDTVFALGILAIRNDKAFALLQKGTDSWFWQKSVRWQSDYGTDNYGILAGRSIQALGISGRPEVAVLLEKLKDTRLTNDTESGPYRRTLNGALMDAVFYDWLIHNESRDAFDRQFFFGSDIFDRDGYHKKWSDTESGKKWRAWSNEFEKKALAEMEERERAQKP